MRLRTRSFSLVLCALAAALFASCSGGGSGGVTPSAGAPVSSGGGPAAAAPKGPGQLNITIQPPASGQFPTLSAAARRDASKTRTIAGTRRLQSLTLGSVVFTATLYPSIYGATPVSVTSVVNTTSVPTSAAVVLNNIPAGNNEWVYIGVEGYDSPNATGSHLHLGDLAGAVNVGTGASYVTVNATSTTAFQVMLAGVEAGVLSSYDLANIPNLSQNIASFISGSPPDPGTLVYSYNALVVFVNQLLPLYNRTLQIAASTGTPTLVSVIVDYRQASELNLITNVNSLYEANLPLYGGSGLVYGSPFNDNYAYTPTGLPAAGTQPATLNDLNSYLLYNNTGSSSPFTIQHVYGGNILIAGTTAPTNATLGSPPYYGAILGVAGRALGNNSAQTLPFTNTTSFNMTIVDPQSAAFAVQNAFSVRYANYGFDNAEFSFSCASSSVCPMPFVITNVVGTQLALTFNEWNPFALPTTYEQICSNIDCVAVSGGATVTLRSKLYDDGTKLSYYNWKPATGGLAGAVTSVAAGGSYYAINYSGGTNGFISTTTTSYLVAGQNVEISSNAPSGTTFTIYANCNGSTYFNTGASNGYGADVTMTSIPATSACGQLLIGFSLPSGSPTSGTVNFYGVE